MTQAVSSARRAYCSVDFTLPKAEPVAHDPAAFADIDRAFAEGLALLAANDNPELDQLEATLDALGREDWTALPVTPRSQPRSGIPAALAEIEAIRAGEPAEEIDLVPAPAPVVEPVATPRRVSKKGNPRPRRSYARSRKSVVILEGYRRDSRGAAPGASVATPSPTPHTPHALSTTPSPSSSTPSSLSTDTRKAPAWRYTTVIEQGTCYARTVTTSGRSGLAWSLNLGGKVAKAANDNPSRFRPWMAKRIATALKASKLGARDFYFGLEVTRSGRVHLHGAVDADVQEIEAVEAALRHAGGAWDHVRHGERQAHAEPLWCPDGWSRYVVKDRALTERTLGITGTLSVTRGCRGRAEALWESARKAA